MSRVRALVGTRLRQLSYATGDLQDWLWKLADRVERTPGATVPHYARTTWCRTGLWRAHGDTTRPLIDGIHPHHRDQDMRIRSITLTPQQREALRRVGEQVQAVNKQVSAMREARRKRAGRHGWA